MIDQGFLFDLFLAMQKVMKLFTSMDMENNCDFNGFKRGKYIAI